jgi:hypothetical protein
VPIIVSIRRALKRRPPTTLESRKEYDVTTTEPVVTTQVIAVDPVVTAQVVDDAKPRRR